MHSRNFGGVDMADTQIPPSCPCLKMLGRIQLCICTWYNSDGKGMGSPEWSTTSTERDRTGSLERHIGSSCGGHELEENH